jgi:hypothetical protein
VVDDVVKKNSFFQEASSIYKHFARRGEIATRDLSSALKVVDPFSGVFDIRNFRGYHEFFDLQPLP